ncbi:replication initiation protein [Hymenobacter nivis]|uniref:RepB family plasmid replication initiator protein n=1 Tax=Hymenobacter nivis TaxID=1850093 RepID=A0A502GAF5_9BACT|nr:replication initiation protein [Hymenobacter nivis]TPG58006.1 RepB family plasmid replication initiator protein [Hymenobacter nivis]
MKTLPKQNADKIVAQHNALVNARFSFVPLQMRLFLALLARISLDDTEFKEHVIPVSELLFERHGGSAYQQLDEMCDDITSFKLYIEILEDGTRKRRRRPKYDYIPLMAKAGYDSDMGGIVAAFNPLIMPYLLQLRESGNFTLADLDELRKLKSPSSVRIYWLLKEYSDFGQRTVTPEQLRFMLNIAENEYPRFSNFKARVLDRAQLELARTDMPFTYELERQNQLVQRIKFLFGYDTATASSDEVEEQNVKLVENTEHLQNTENANQPAADEPAWIQALRLIGVSLRSIKQIIKQLEDKEYPLEYVDFVLSRIGKQHQLGKVKKPAGAVYKALVEKYLLEEYLAGQKVSKAIPVKKASAAVKAKLPLLEEVAFPLREVRDMYENPGPFLKRQLKEPTFELHLEAIYLSQGFALVKRDGDDWLVKNALP